MDIQEKNQEMSNRELKENLRILELTYRDIAKRIKKDGKPRKPQQVSDAVNTSEQPGLRKKIIKLVIRELSNHNNVNNC